MLGARAVDGDMERYDDEKIIYEFAQRLHKQADTLLYGYGFTGVVLGFLLGYLGSIAARSSDRALFALVGAGICAAIEPGRKGRCLSCA